MAPRIYGALRNLLDEMQQEIESLKVASETNQSTIKGLREHVVSDWKRIAKLEQSISDAAISQPTPNDPQIGSTEDDGDEEPTLLELVAEAIGYEPYQTQEVKAHHAIMEVAAWIEYACNKRSDCYLVDLDELRQLAAIEEKE